MNERDTYRSQFAASFAGRLSAEDVACLEAALARDEKLAREAEALQPLAVYMADSAQAEASHSFRLSADRLGVIRAAAAGHIVDFPGTSRPSRERSRWDALVLRRVAPALAAAAAVLIGTFAGFNAGREDANYSAGSWQMATQIEPASRAAGSVPDYYYPPAYGLDHGVSWPAHGGATLGFAESAPPNYGLPGPRPVYLIRGDSFLLQ